MIKYTLLCLFVLCSLQNTYASDWIAYRNDVSTTNTQIIRSQTITHQIQYPMYSPALTYSWTPIYTYQPVIINRQGLFCHRSDIVQVPVVSWVYQPTIVWPGFYYR